MVTPPKAELGSLTHQPPAEQSQEPPTLVGCPGIRQCMRILDGVLDKPKGGVKSYHLSKRHHRAMWNLRKIAQLNNLMAEDTGDDGTETMRTAFKSMKRAFYRNDKDDFATWVRVLLFLVYCNFVEPLDSQY